MESEAGQEAEQAETTRMTQAPPGNVDSTNIKQDAKQIVVDFSRMWRRGERCKDYFLTSKFCCLCIFGLLMVLIIVLGIQITGCPCISVEPPQPHLHRELWKLSIKYVFCLSCAVHHGKFPREQCPSEWIGYKMKCYFISEEEENWTSSQAFCARYESLLAVFENQEEMHSLAKHLRIDDCWIGLSKKEESFYWENGISFEEDSFKIQNHSECAYLDTFTISTSACSLPRCWICFQLPK